VVSQYDIDPLSGGLSPKTPTTVLTGGLFAARIAVTPDGKSAYVSITLDSLEGRVAQYDIDPLSGALSPKTPATVPTGGLSDSGPAGIAVTPDGKSAYVANSNRSTVSQYDIDPQSGALSLKSPATVAAGSEPVSVAVTPDGKSAYVPDADGVVHQYDIDPQTGALSPKTPDSVLAGQQPFGVAVTPDGKSAYVTNSNALGPTIGTDTVSQYDIDPLTGALSPKTPATVPTGTFSRGIAVTPDGNTAYVANGVLIGFPPGPRDNAVSQYDIDPLTGALSPKTPAAVPAGTGAFQVVVSPDGRSAYVTNFHDASVSQYDINPQTGTLSPKSPATVPTPITANAPLGIAVGPLPRVPTSKAQCKNEGWRNFPQFKNEGQCIAFVKHAP
jgi:DNA-binding beta-propeller fold protein YncE